MPLRDFSLLTAALALLSYAALAWHFTVHWLNRPALSLPRRPHGEHTLVGVALVLHALSITLPAGHWLALGVGQAVSVVMWLTVLIYWCIGLIHRMEGLQLPLMWMAAIGVLLSLLLPRSHVAYDLAQPMVAAHILISLTGYSLFLLAALTAVLMLVVDHLLHAKKLTTRLPPLLTLEKLLFRFLWVAFLLLTLTVLSGIGFSEQIFGKPFALSHKSVFSLISWLVFALLLGGRIRYGWRGRVAARWTLGGGALLFLAYFGSKLVLELILLR